MKYWVVNRTTHRVVDVFTYGYKGGPPYKSGTWDRATKLYTAMYNDGYYYVEIDKERI